MKTSTRRANSHQIKIVVAIAALLSLATLLALVPLWEGRSEYCFYCGRITVVIRCVGVTVHTGSKARGNHNDGVVLPPHEHRMIVSNRSRLWAFHGQEHLDEFGWTGRGYRQALLAGIAAHPERKQEIIAEFLRAEPDRESGKAFLKSYGKRTGL